MENKDENLWRQAQKRVKFKRHLFTYIWVNIFLWVIWFFTRGEDIQSTIPWPAWTTFFWGIGLGFSYYNIYHSSDNAVEKEYEKLKNNN
ncbi:MAG: 2TM domain-containing protein [Chitinophagales bacterium]